MRNWLHHGIMFGSESHFVLVRFAGLDPSLILIGGLLLVNIVLNIDFYLLYSAFSGG